MLLILRAKAAPGFNAAVPLPLQSVTLAMNDFGLDGQTAIKFTAAGLPAFNLCESGQVGNEAATAK